MFVCVMVVGYRKMYSWPQLLTIQQQNKKEEERIKSQQDTESLLHIIGERSSDSGRGGAEKHLGLGTSCCGGDENMTRPQIPMIQQQNKHWNEPDTTKWQPE
jgi:hypothetical protein